MTERATDVLVLGGGPAGATLALLLARSGIAVDLVDHGRLHASGPHETLLPAAAPVLRRLGLVEVFASTAIRDPLRHGAIWRTPEVEWQAAGEPGWLLARGAFDRGLRNAARAAGARVHEGCVVEHDVNDRWHVLRSQQILSLAPRFVAVATGRGGGPG
jgi:2-polyprenyl-6-methoxyphenol hydroxylase-like FAD-dependent oxidoreductase